MKTLYRILLAGCIAQGLNAQDLLSWDVVDSGGVVIQNSQLSKDTPYSFPIYNDEGLAPDTIAMEMNFPDSNFGQGSAFCVYFEDEAGVITDGKAIWTDVKDLGIETFNITASDWGMAQRFGIVLILNAGSMGKDFVDGVVFDLVKDAKGDYDVVFQGKKKNANLQFIPVSVNTVTVNGIVPGSEWVGALQGDVLSAGGTGVVEATSLDVLDGDGDLCWKAKGPNSLVGFARSNFHVPPGQLKKDKEITAGIALGEDGKAYVVEHGKVKKEIPLNANAGGHGFCIRRENEKIVYSYEGEDVFTSYWVVQDGVPLMVNVILTETGSVVEAMSGKGFVDRKTDFDMDGLPNEWEEMYGLDPRDKSDALEDADGDGVLNWMEYQDGQNPTVPQYVPIPQNYLWWLRAQDFVAGQQWDDLSLRGHDSLSDTTGIEYLEEVDGKKYAMFDLGDEAEFGSGDEPWLTTDGSAGTETNIADFTLMVVCRPLWNGPGYENLIDLSVSDSTNGFRIGIQDGAWLLESEGSEGAFLENVEHTVEIDKEVVLVVRYHGATGLAEIWINGERQTWAGKALIRNITGKGYIHRISNIEYPISKAERMGLILEGLLSLFVPSAHAQAFPMSDPFAMMREVILWGRTLTYSEIATLNASMAYIPDETLFQTWADYCGNYSGDPQDDPDGDGLSIEQEIMLGTDPNNPDSNIDLSISNNFNGTIQLKWLGAEGRAYGLESSDNLFDWSLDTLEYGEGQNIQIILTPAGLQFWRVKVEGAYDSDGDHIPDWLELCIGSNPNAYDTDDDGISDGAEITYGTAPNRCERLDTDSDGIDDYYETTYTFLSPFDPADALLDQDSDGADNLTEYLRHTNPQNPLDSTGTVYVDAATPDNSYSGYQRTFYGCDGPKRDFQAAIYAAQDGDTIHFEAGIHIIPNPLDGQGKSLFLSADGPVYFVNQ